MPFRSRLFLCLPFLVLLLTGPRIKAAPGTENSPDTPADGSTRPRIGLVLGGGGARGAAHVGVLQALEEMRIPVDMVSGTSMGSIVGALFSIGLTPDQIQGEISGIDWDDLFSDRPRRQDRKFRRKQDDTSFFVPVEFGWKDNKVVFSSGIIAGQKLGFAFRHKNLFLGGHHSFDDLAYPFRPVATDLLTGEMVVLDRGNLLKAVRASMSIPGVFPPVRWADHYLVDGFLTRNLPVDVVREMGADIVIAVDVGPRPASTDPETFQSILGITTQQSLIQAHANVAAMLPLADVVIHVDLGDIKAEDFRRVAETIPLGRQAAQALREQLQAYSLGPEAYQEHLDQHRLDEPEKLIIHRIELENHSQVSDLSILKNLHQATGSPLDLDQLKTDLVNLHDFGVFQLVDFEVLQDDAGRNTLRVIAHEKYYAPNILNFGVTYSGGDQGRSFLETRFRWTRMEMNSHGTEIRTDLQLGRNNGIRSELYLPLAMNRRPFLATAVRWRNLYQDWFRSDINLGELQQEDVTGMVDLGYRLGRLGEFRLGVEYGFLQAADNTNLHLYDFESPRGGYVAALELDSQDASYLPRQGLRFSSRVFWGRPELGGGLDYVRLQARGKLVHSWGPDTIALGAAGGSCLNTEWPEFAAFTLGGPENLEGYQPDSLRGGAFGLASLHWYRQIKGSPSPYSASWYLGVRLEAGNVWEKQELASLRELRFSASISLTVKTVLGPLTLSLAQADGGNDAFSATLGGVPSFLR
jgi:NTE family protein